jgi:hypothetical protein
MIKRDSNDFKNDEVVAMFKVKTLEGKLLEKL